MSNRKLSKYMTEQKFCFSDTATKLKIKNIFTATALLNAVIFCQDFLDPICDYYAKILNTQSPASLLILSSGYRCVVLNKNPSIGGDPKSQHQFGNAGDINIYKIQAKRLFNDIISGRIKQRNGKYLKDIVDQCIYERKSNGAEWVHLGRAGKPRKQFLKANLTLVNGKYQSSYVTVNSEI